MREERGMHTKICRTFMLVAGLSLEFLAAPSFAFSSLLSLGFTASLGLAMLMMKVWEEKLLLVMEEKAEQCRERGFIDFYAFITTSPQIRNGRLTSTPAALQPRRLPHPIPPTNLLLHPQLHHRLRRIPPPLKSCTAFPPHISNTTPR